MVLYHWAKQRDRDTGVTVIILIIVTIISTIIDILIRDQYDSPRSPPPHLLSPNPNHHPVYGCFYYQQGT
ncbi:hypothetical protein ElyMa_002707000 [Elysia marginata]|uniref:Uncharacterized protein n=1 Tax=Elysia marginata TaxID=1093978 RepID=A0AAV4HFV8_9GAST|nr:hypothetical protein ElyMa_002707000 [Elysia marginata]